jgi:LmbE family N-acetylglucosaminyl deacetylase
MPVLDLALSSISGKRRLQVLCVGAHCDDIEIGCGGTVIEFQKMYPDCRLHWLVLTSNAERRKEALASARDFVRASCRGETRICEFPDGLLPACFADVKAEFERVKSALEPDLILTHHLEDSHQDHKLLGEVTWQTFRDHMIWEYEIPKYDGDLAKPNFYVPLSTSAAKRKVDVIARRFFSQSGKSWFRPENLHALMRIRGMEVRSASGLAEAFHCRKLQCNLGALTKADRARFRPANPPRRRA